MPSPVRLAAALLAVVSSAALAQTAVPPTTTVQQLAPQLLTFAGSPLNFTSLVNGLAAGGPVQLTTVLPNGFTQVVTFTPNAALAPVQIAQVLESARQQLISLGVPTPTAEQIGFTLMGGLVPTALGGANVPGVLNPQNPISGAAQIQRNAAAGGSASFSPQPPASSTSPLTPAPGVTSSVNVQFIPNATVPATTGTTTGFTGPAAQVRNTSDSPFPAGSTSFSPTSGSTSTTPPPDTTTPPTQRAVPPSAGTPPAGRPTRQ